MNRSSGKKRGIIYYWLSHQEVEYIVPLWNINWPSHLLGLGLRKYYSVSSRPFQMLLCVTSPCWPAGDMRLSQDVSEDILPLLILAELLDNCSHMSGPSRKPDWFSLKFVGLQNHE